MLFSLFLGEMCNLRVKCKYFTVPRRMYLSISIRIHKQIFKLKDASSWFEYVFWGVFV